MKQKLLQLLFLFFAQVTLGQVNADFTVSSTSGCAPLIVNFLDISSGATSWLWDFGNGVTSTQQNPTYVFSQPGFYTIKLTASDGVNSDTETKSALIRVNAAPIPDFSVNNDKGCSPHQAVFSDLSIPQSGTVNQWFWAFGNGQTSTNQNPITTYTDIKSYDVYLKIVDINGCEASITKKEFIQLDGPKADFLYDSVVCGLPANVLFLNQSSGNNLDYHWDFGDGVTSTDQVPGVHSYSTFDSTEVELIVTEKKTGCSDTIKKPIIVGNYQATFDYQIICGVNNYTINVQNTTADYKQLEWNFNNSEYKFTPNATYNHPSTNVSTITLKTTIDESCWDTTTISYRLPFPFASYSADSCGDPFDVKFTNSSIGSQLTYYWDFGDSTFSSNDNPVHTYNIPPESFKAKLYATDQFGCIDSQTISVFVPFPIARFEEINDKYTGCTPLSLTFEDKSYVKNTFISSVKWDFGDPGSPDNNSTSLTPSHVYNKPGDYDITYIVFTDDGCSDTNTYKSIIKAGEKPISADFQLSPNDTICFGDAINFNENAIYNTAGITSNYYCWAFYEDQPNLLTDPETPPADCPNIGVFNKFYSYVNIDEPSHTYRTFNVDNDTLNDTVFIANITPEAGLLYTHLFIGYNNCLSEVVKPNFIDTTIAINGYIAKNFTELYSCGEKEYGFFQASLNYDKIDYSFIREKGTTDTLFKIPENDTLWVKLPINKKYEILTQVSNSISGCESSVTDELIMDSTSINFDLPEKVCLSDNPVLFDDNSNASLGTLFARNWLINGVKGANGINNDSIYYNFPDTGLFEIGLEITYRGLYQQHKNLIWGYCTDTVYKSIMIEGVKAKLSIDTNNLCKGDTVFFSNKSVSTNLLKDSEWHFGDDSDSSVIHSPFHIYNSIGTFTGNLFVSDTMGCTDSIALPQVSVLSPIVNFSASDTLICKYDAISLKNLSQGNNLSFLWTIDTISQFSIDIVHKFDSVGDFDVKLVATDISNCKDSLIKTAHIKVEDFPVSNFGGSPTYIDCPPLTTLFKDSTLTPVVKWKWNFGDGGTSTDQNPSHIFTAPGLYDVQLITTNYAACSDTLTIEEYIEIDGPFGEVSFSPDTLCIPDSVIFDQDFYKTNFYIWNFGDGNIVSYNYADFPDSTIHEYIQGGLFQPSIELIDSKGCFYSLPQLPEIIGDSIAAQFEVPGNIICDVSNIPFTNTSRYTYPSSFLWDMGDTNKLTDVSPIYTYISDSTYTVKLVQTSPLGCVDSSLKTIKVFNAPYPSLEITNENFCIPSESEYKITFDNSNFEPDSLYFIFDDVDTEIGDSVVKTFTTSGDHKVRFVIEYGSGNCIVDSIQNVKYYKWPVADFNYSPQNNSLEEPVVFFENLSINSDSWLWDFDDFDQSTSKSPGHNFNMQGVYEVRLIATNQGGCSDTIYQDVTMSPFNFVKLPSAFSPNGDGQNETFGILRAGDLEIQEFKIFNRWGNVVFETTDKDEFWDGKRKGKDQDVGTYIYYIKGTDKGGSTVEIKGNFTLLR